MANLKGSNFTRQIKDVNHRLSAFSTNRHGTNSHKTFSDATRVKRDTYMKDFKKFAEDKDLDGKLNQLMDEDNLSEFFEERLNDVSFNTQEDYIRGWSGMVQGLQESNITINLDTSFFNEQVTIYKDDAMERGESIGEPKLITTEFHPLNAINGLSYPMNVIAQVQYETGFRVSEAYDLINNLEKHLSDLKINSLKGKAGQMYQSKIISIELKIMLLKLQAEQRKLPVQSTYYRNLQRYNMSSHDIRAFYSKELYEQKIDDGLSHIDACSFVSKEINHHRISITEYYLAKFGDLA